MHRVPDLTFVQRGRILLLYVYRLSAIARYPSLCIEYRVSRGLAGKHCVSRNSGVNDKFFKIYFYYNLAILFTQIHLIFHNIILNKYSSAIAHSNR